MLKDILEAEKKAREAALKAESYKTKAVAEIEKETEKIISDKLREAEAKVAELRAAYQKDVDESMQAAESESRAAAERFLALEKEKSAEWADAVFSRVISDES